MAEPQPTPSLPEAHPNGSQVQAAFDAVYNWNYEPEIDELRTLYANALDRQWIAMRDLDWNREIDKSAFAETRVGMIPVQETDYWQTLDDDTRWEISRRSAAFLLSNFLHGEQGALMVAAQLVNAVPHMDGKFYASTQTLDEARHVEVFAAYINKLDEVQEIAPSLKELLDDVLATDDWMKKAVGMQVVTEGLALYSFRDMRNQTREPLLKDLLTNVTRDEARHTGYGIKYLNAIVPTLDEATKAEIEDYAFEAARKLVDSRGGTSMRESVFQIWREAGVDPMEAFAEIMKEREKIAAAIQAQGGRRGPIRGFVIPTLRGIGLFSERIQSHFDDMFQNNLGALAGTIADDPADLPEDLEAWALGE